MFMYYCGQKGSKFGELKMVSKTQTAAKVLRSRENHVETKKQKKFPPRNAHGGLLVSTT